MGVNDLGEVTPLVVRCLGRSWHRDALESALENPLDRSRLARDDASTLVGFLFARRVAALVEIDLLGVAPEARRQGLGRQLVGLLLAEEVATGAEEGRLELRESNRAGREFYEAMGFVVVGSRSRYYPDGETALLLTLAAPAVSRLASRET